MEQATLVRRAVKDPGVPLLRESMVPAPAPASDGGQSLPVNLTDDELQLLAEIATGVTTDVAARRLELSARTLRRRLRAICDQLGVNTPIEAVVWAARKQLI
ncbi:LuxR C-terminal-related transcriptional regulator [Nocardiopsis trehalosi]|uniref:LuxR C-terminal-related transcriptional regulator n=1 Tax=Nocardiopsis trehalosi TaxID=109329 RepID=UPI0008306171|nr:LuxR C-terminal-related transcriptional regulator [Nocardiopsis trehalosi]